jgi:hypothetical protein
VARPAGFEPDFSVSEGLQTVTSICDAARRRRRARDPDEYLNEPPIQRSAADRGVRVLLFGYDTSVPIGRREIMGG